MILKWEDAGNDGYQDQNANTALVPHGYWSLSDDSVHSKSWAIELVEQDADLEHVGYLHGGSFATEDQAKAHAQTIEDDEASTKHIAAVVNTNGHAVSALTAETMLDVLGDIAHSSAFELPSDRVGLKAAHLVDEGSVRGPRRAIVYTISGETGFYQTTLYLRGTGRLREIVGHSCPCDARWQCAHVLAALVRAYQDGYKIATVS